MQRKMMPDAAESSALDSSPSTLDYPRSTLNNSTRRMAPTATVDLKETEKNLATRRQQAKVLIETSSLRCDVSSPRSKIARFSQISQIERRRRGVAADDNPCRNRDSRFQSYCECRFSWHCRRRLTHPAGRDWHPRSIFTNLSCNFRRRDNFSAGRDELR